MLLISGFSFFPVSVPAELNSDEECSIYFPKLPYACEETIDFTKRSNVVNNPPNTPSKPIGPSNGVVFEWLTYSTSSTDPDGDNIRYGFDIDYDGEIDKWSDLLYPSGVTCTFSVLYHYPGTYRIRVLANDTNGALSNWSESKVVVITEGNSPPNIPSKPSGPSDGSINVSYFFQTNATDPNGDEIRYGWDWNGDDLIDEWTDYYLSGEMISISHLFTNTGTFYIRVRAEDEEGAQSPFSSTKIIEITGDQPPNQPQRPDGPATGKSGMSYIYSTSTTDNDGDNIYYLFDWGDDTESSWIGPYNSGSTVNASHIWLSKGTFIVKVKAKDDPNGDGNLDDGTESVWSESLSVRMPKNKVFDTPLVQLFKNHPKFVPVLRFLLNI